MAQSPADYGKVILLHVHSSSNSRSLTSPIGLSYFLVITQAKRLKAIMIAAAELAAVRVRDLPSTKRDFEIDHQDQVFCLLDKNNDGKISIEELTEVMEELGAQGEDACEMMMLLDSNSDGFLSSDEFDKFQKQVYIANI